MSTQAATKTKKRRSGGLVEKQNRAGYIFVLPIAVGFVLVFLPMFVQTVIFSFNNVNVSSGFSLEYIGTAMYQRYLTQNEWFMKTSVSTFRNILIDLVCVLIFSFFIAVLLNQKFHGRTAARIIFFLPVILAAGVVAQVENGDVLMSMIQQTQSVDTGELDAGGVMGLSTLLQSSGLPKWVYAIITDVASRTYSILVASGVQILIFLSGLQSISPSLYEAAKVEGASGWESFWKITFPMISPMILVNGVYTMIDASTKSTNPIMQQVLYDTTTGKYTDASVIALMYLLVVAVMLVIIFGIIKGLIYYQT